MGRWVQEVGTLLSTAGHLVSVKTCIWAYVAPSQNPGEAKAGLYLCCLGWFDCSFGVKAGASGPVLP